MKFKFQDILMTGKRLLICRDPKCEANQLSSKKWHKRTLLPIKCLASSNSRQKSEKLLYYICSECSYYNCDSFGKPVTNLPLNLQTYVIPDHIIEDFEKMVKSRGPQKCLFCKLGEIIDADNEYVEKEEINRLENQLKEEHSLDIKKEFEERLGRLKSTRIPIYKIKESVYKLFIKGKPKRRDYVGFLCLNCNAIFYDPGFNYVKWPRTEIRKINPTAPWSKLFNKKMWNELKYHRLKKLETNTNNMVEKQELETWHNLEIESPPSPHDIEIKYLGPVDTGGIPSEPRTDRVTITLENLTIRKAIEAIRKFGSEELKEEFMRLGYL